MVRPQRDQFPARRRAAGRRAAHGARRRRPVAHLRADAGGRRCRRPDRGAGAASGRHRHPRQRRAEPQPDLGGGAHGPGGGRWPGGGHRLHADALSAPTKRRETGQERNDAGRKGGGSSDGGKERRREETAARGLALSRAGLSLRLFASCHRACSRRYTRRCPLSDADEHIVALERVRPYRPEEKRAALRPAPLLFVPVATVHGCSSGEALTETWWRRRRGLGAEPWPGGGHGLWPAAARGLSSVARHPRACREDPRMRPGQALMRQPDHKLFWPMAAGSAPDRRCRPGLVRRPARRTWLDGWRPRRGARRPAARGRPQRRHRPTQACQQSPLIS